MFFVFSPGLYKLIVRLPLKSHYTANEARCSIDVSEAKQQLSNLRYTLTTAFKQLDQLEEKISAISQGSSYLALSPQSRNSDKGTISTDHNISPSSSCSPLISQEKTHVNRLEEDELCTEDSSTSNKIIAQDSISISDMESSRYTDYSSTSDKITAQDSISISDMEFLRFTDYSSTSDKITAQDSISDIESSSDNGSEVGERPLPSFSDIESSISEVEERPLPSFSDIESSISEVEERPLPLLKNAVEHEDQSDNSDLHTGQDTPSVLIMSPGMFGFYGFVCCSVNGVNW